MVTNFIQEPAASILNLEMEAADSSETVVITYNLTQYPDLEDHNTHHHRNLSARSYECQCWAQYNVHVKCTAMPLMHAHFPDHTMCLVWYCYHPWGKPCYRINFTGAAKI